MQKIQILFPDPMMERIREAARREDVPLSDIIRRATAAWLDHLPRQEAEEKQVPVIDAGRCLIDAENMREALYE